MALPKVSHVADAEHLLMLVGQQPAAALVLRLYTNDVTPDGNESAMAFVEPIGNGYQPIRLDPALWQVAKSMNGDVEVIYPETTFEFTGPAGAIYGYFFTRQTTGTLAGAVRLSGDEVPFRVKHRGDRLFITPRLRRQ